MRNYIDIATYKSKSPSIVTIGTFDGVHIGHQKIINKLTKLATEKQLQSVVLTFFPHPRMVLQNNSSIKLLNTIDEKHAILADLGLDHLIVKKFTLDFANMSAKNFVKNVLVDQLNAKYIIIGYDHQFGKNRSANIDDLRNFGKEFDFEVEEISVQDIEDVAVSSTKIRNALNIGDIKTANTFLGYPYFLTGKVVGGKGLGKQIGFPTANIWIEADYKLIPKNGVYLIQGHIDEKVIYGMMNIGINPTVDHDTKQSIEAHFFDFDENIYDKTIKLELLDYLRDEHKFESIEALKTQLKEDRRNAQTILSSNE